MHVIPKPENRPPGVKARTFLFEALTSGANPISTEHANALMDNEVIFEKSIGINDLNELASGRVVKNKWVAATPEEQAAYLKFMKILFAVSPEDMAKQGTFTADERRLLMRQDDEVIRMRDSQGFLARVVQYAASADQLRHVLGVMKPDVALSGVKFAENSPVDEKPRLAAAQRILNISPDAA